MVSGGVTARDRRLVVAHTAFKGMLSPQPRGHLPFPSAVCVVGRLVCSEGKQGRLKESWVILDGWHRKVCWGVSGLCSQLELITTMLP